MRKLYYYLLLGCICSCVACSSFLDETPNKSGSAYIYHMDQLYGMTGNYNYYQDGYVWQDLIFRGDGIEYTPYYAKKTGNWGEAYDVWGWETDYLENTLGSSGTWEPCWNAIYGYNTVLEYLDDVIQTTPATRKQVEGEARFGRAYFHFMLLVQYALWDEEAPGIGYRTGTGLTDIPARKTVGYTLSKIYEDLTLAETLLTEAGRTTFEPERNFRPTVPTVKALRARIDLYRGDYTSALQNARDALAGYDVLLDFKNDPLYVVYDKQGAIQLLNRENNAVAETVYFKQLLELEGKGIEACWKYAEFYLPHMTGLHYANRALPVSESYASLFDRENDERWIRFYDNNHILYSTALKEIVDLPGFPKVPNCVTWESQQGIREANRYTYMRFCSGFSVDKYYLLGMTTAEMYLIEAECMSRAGDTDGAAQVLRKLRKTRFTTEEAANRIGGSLQEVLDERAREMTEVWRFFDIKRLNGADKAGIRISRTLLTDPANSDATHEIVVEPDDSRWALPIDLEQLLLMGWEQN